MPYRIEKRQPWISPLIIRHLELPCVKPGKRHPSLRSTGIWKAQAPSTIRLGFLLWMCVSGRRRWNTGPSRVLITIPRLHYRASRPVQWNQKMQASTKSNPLTVKHMGDEKQGCAPSPELPLVFFFSPFPSILFFCPPHQDRRSCCLVLFIERKRNKHNRSVWGVKGSKHIESVSKGVRFKLVFYMSLCGTEPWWKPLQL